MKAFRERLTSDTPILYDGGFGSQLFARDIQLVNSALANESHPTDVVGIHADYISAGAEVIGTNTFVVSPLHLQMAGQDNRMHNGLHDSVCNMRKLLLLRVKEMFMLPVLLDHRRVRLKQIVAIPPSVLQMLTCVKAHKLVIHTLAEEGVDFLCLETMFSAKEAAIAVDIARETGLPIAVNLTYKWTKDRKTM